MKSIIFLALVAFTFISCTNGQSQNGIMLLSASAFETKIKENANAPIIDVRTPEEFFDGHLPNAQNINWKGASFEKQIAELDKTQPVFIYCLSGGRSAAATKKMQADGFTQIYELKGGISSWRASNYNETKGSK